MAKTTTTATRKPLTPAQKARKNELARARRAAKKDAERAAAVAAYDPVTNLSDDEYAALRLQHDADLGELASDADADADADEPTVVDETDQALEAMAAPVAVEHARPRSTYWWRKRTVGRPSKEELVAAVRQVALEQYNRNGWDYVVEAYSDEDIIRAIGTARSVRGAVWNVGNEVMVKARHRAEIQATAF